MSNEQEELPALPAGLKPYYDFRSMRKIPHLLRYSAPENYTMPLSQCKSTNLGVPITLPYYDMFTTPNTLFGGRERSNTYSFSPGISGMAVSNSCYHDGSILLGKEDETNNCIYATRYHIQDRNQQHKSITKDVIMEYLLPCCHGENSNKDRIIAFFQSDLLLITLHMLVLTIGMIKGLVHPYELFTNIHLLEAVIESVLTSTIILIRAFLGAQKYFDVKQCHMEVENMKEPSNKFLILKFFSSFQIVASFFLVSLTIVTFITFYTYISLNWTTLVNNFLILISYMLSSIVGHSGNILIQQVSLDQHKVALFESEMLLGELYFAMTTIQKAQVKHRVECFLKGLKSTPKFNIPSYISCSTKLNDGFVVNMESGV